MDTIEQEIAAEARAAIERIRTQGWAQGDNLDGCKTCLFLSYRAYLPQISRRIRTLIGAPVEVDDAMAFQIIAWNDAPGRSVDDVIGVLERVAAGEGAS